MYNHIPIYAVDLIKMLDSMYPEQCPSINEDERSIWMYAGKRELVRHLKFLLEKDNEKGVKNDA